MGNYNTCIVIMPCNWDCSKIIFYLSYFFDNSKVSVAGLLEINAFLLDMHDSMFDILTLVQYKFKVNKAIRWLINESQIIININIIANKEI